MSVPDGPLNYIHVHREPIYFSSRYLRQYQSVLKQKLTLQEPSDKDVSNRHMSLDIVPFGINLDYLKTSSFTLTSHHVIYSVVNFDIHNVKSNIQPKKWSDRLATAKRKAIPMALSCKDSGSGSGDSHFTSEESPEVNTYSDSIHQLEDRISDNRLSDISSAGRSQENDVMSN